MHAKNLGTFVMNGRHHYDEEVKRNLLESRTTVKTGWRPAFECCLAAAPHTPPPPPTMAFHSEPSWLQPLRRPLVTSYGACTTVVRWWLGSSWAAMEEETENDKDGGHEEEGEGQGREREGKERERERLVGA